MSPYVKAKTKPNLNQAKHTHTKTPKPKQPDKKNHNKTQYIPWLKGCKAIKQQQQHAKPLPFCLNYRHVSSIKYLYMYFTAMKIIYSL